MKRNSEHKSAALPTGLLPVRVRLNGLLLCGLLLMWALAAGCSSTPVTGRTVTSAAGIETVVLVPFTDLTEVYGESGLIACPLNPKYFEAGPTEENAGQVLTVLTDRQLIRKREFDVARWNRKLAEIPADRGRFNQERKFVMRVGRESGADAVLVGYLYEFRQRLGEKYAADTPAAVAFSLHLVRTENGADVWYGFFEETQQALSENLFRLPLFIERGASWQTAEELAQYGLEALWKTFPQRQSDSNSRE